jgi:HlyD family secretion protein
MSKKIISAVVFAAAVLGFGAYWFLFKEKKPEFVFKKAERGAVLQKVAETGSVKLSDELNIGFKNSGRIKKIYVKVGDNVEPGQILAEIDTAGLKIELDKERVALELAKAKKSDAEVSLKNAEQNLKNIQASAGQELKNAYEDAVNVLNDSYLKIYNSFRVVSDIKREHFNSNDQEGRRVAENKTKIENALNKANFYLNGLESGSPEEKIDQALLEIKTALEQTKEALEAVRETTETVAYRNLVSSADKTSLDNQKSDIITGLTNLINAQQTISSARVNNRKSIDDAQAQISSLKNQLRPGGLYDAQINQAQAEIKLLENEIAEAVLRAPEKGQITAVDEKEGEVVQPSDSVISLLPASRFKIEVDIYEEDIVKVKIGQPADIVLTAFPGRVFKGRVVSIDPAEKLIEDVVYYKVTINFLDLEKGLKPGMTADITIKTAEKDNVLIVPKEAVENRDGRKLVQVRQKDGVENRQIEIGLEGENFFEVLSGLKEGEEVVVGKKI